ncbi:hypothetical protein B0H11DRAFT_2078595 [Mycena galericulata]|nr:hypothetical protein B0H11DRAFT_2078595 [Mycena galericulata]
MPSSFVQDIDVNSPLVQYAGAWQLGGADGDPEVVKYNQDTFVYCAGTPCSATISFNGTEIHVVGAYRTNSGPFQVVLDGQTFGPFGTTATVTEQFQIDLFNKTEMRAGLHTLTISNVQAPNAQQVNMNLDYFTWTNEVNSLTDLRIQDDTSAFVYEPPAAWSSFTSPSTSFPGFDGTGHSTVQGGATATFSFMGDRVALYGAIGSQGGPYSVAIDNGTPSSLTAQRLVSDATTPVPNYLPGQMLFYADSLSLGNHTITVTANPTSPTQDISIDYAIVDGTLNSNTTSPSRPNNSPSPGHKQTLSSAAIGGIAAGVAVLGICLILLAYILYLRRRRSYDSGKDAQLEAQMDTTPRPVSFHFSPSPQLAPPPSQWTQGRNTSISTDPELDPPRYEAIGQGTASPTSSRVATASSGVPYFSQRKG